MTVWFIYILLCRDGSLYTGIAKDVGKRLNEHQSGKGGAYTRSHPPIRIIHTEPAKNRSAALIREAEIKRWSRSKKIKILNLSLMAKSSSM